MPVKIGLISDVHAKASPLAEALTLFAREGVDTILCAGDIAGYGSDLALTVQLLKENHCLTVAGNHDLWALDRSDSVLEESVDSYLRSLPKKLEFFAAGKSLYLVHASPPDSQLNGIKLLDEKGRLIGAQKEFWNASLHSFPYDLLVVGHTHQLFVERFGDLLVVNPGSTVFNHSCMILHLPEMAVQILPLSGKKPLLAWNWGVEAQMTGISE